ncbi:MAG: MBL fold metallo-hydrolase [Pseudomonadota bacterium]
MTLPRIADLGNGIRRVLAPNPSMMTGPGTNTYLIGGDDVAVVDPGPALPEHLDHIRAESGRIRWIFVTHTHPDHSPGAAVLAADTGAELIGMPAPATAHQDSSFVPDWHLEDGDSLQTTEFELLAVHTPGHASNHVCYLHAESGALLTGDHVIDGSTVVINPPDGNMRDYLNSLRRILELNVAAILPGHGDRIDDPQRVVNWIIEHRLAREDKVVAAFRRRGSATAAELVEDVYQDVPEHLHGWAERSLLAHLIKLQEDGAAGEESGRFTWREKA